MIPLNHHTVLVCSALVLLVLSLVQLAYGRKRDNFRPALDMGLGGLAFALLCTFYVIEPGLGPMFQAVPVVLVALKIFFIYRANRGIFGVKAADSIDYVMLILGIALGSVTVYLVGFGFEQILYALYVAYFYSKAFVIVVRASSKLPRTFLAFIYLYLSLYIIVFVTRAVYFMIVPWGGFTYSMSEYGAGTTLITLILFICESAGGLIIAVFKADQDRITALEAAVAERDFANDLVTIIGHDLNGSLAGIRQGAELISNTADPSLPIINGYSLKASNLLTDLIYYGRSRLEDPKALVSHSMVGTLIAAAVSDIQFAADIKGLTIDISEVNKSEMVHVDAAAARVVLRNILQNSLKFSSPGKTITIGPLKGENEIAAVISDKGWGMTPAQLTVVRNGKIAQSREGSSGEKGTGTGLRLIASICQSQGWSMDIESTPGEGTTTTVWFPAAEISSPSDPPPQH